MFQNIDKEKKSLAILADALGITLVNENADLAVTVELCEEDALSVSLNVKTAKIVYGGGLSRFNRAIGLLFEALAAGKTAFEKKETPSFEKNGFYLDVSRNAVMRPSTVKEMIKKIALMGMNTFWLYMEDTYEVKNNPYFGLFLIFIFKLSTKESINCSCSSIFRNLEVFENCLPI